VADVPRSLHSGGSSKSIRKYHKLIAERLKECLRDSTHLLTSAKELEDTRFLKAADTIYQFGHGLMNYRPFPPEHGKKIRTANLLERVHKEPKRQTRNAGAFSNDASFIPTGCFDPHQYQSELDHG
jgi:putative transposase